MATSTWLDEHLESFVRPVLGEIPNIPTTWCLRDDAPKMHKDGSLSWDAYDWVHRFTPARVALLRTMWEEAKRLMEAAKKSKILLPGRDVYLLEILAKVEGWDGTVFRPEISSTAASTGVQGFPDVPRWAAECFGVDSGYRGSIFTGLKVPTFTLVSYGGGSVDPQTKAGRAKLQLFPNANTSISTNMCVDMECCPKYWQRGDVNFETKKVSQTKAPKAEFEAAAILTQHVVKALDPSVTVAVPTTYDRVLGGRLWDKPIGVNVKEGRGWYLNEPGGPHSCSVCSGIYGVVNYAIKGCHKPLKRHEWFFGSLTTDGAMTGSLVCRKCAEGAGHTAPTQEEAKALDIPDLEASVYVGVAPVDQPVLPIPPPSTPVSIQIAALLKGVAV